MFACAVLSCGLHFLTFWSADEGEAVATGMERVGATESDAEGALVGTCVFIGKNTPGIGIDMPGFGIDMPGNGNDMPGFGNDMPGYGNDKPGYGNEMPG